MNHALPPGALMGADTADSPGRYELRIDRWQVLRRFERESAAPESWVAVCSCGRCDGRGALFILTSGAEEWRPHRPDGTGFDPKEASRYGYGGWKR